MTRICELTGVTVASGNNVSHSQRKTRRRFLPNLHQATLRSELLSEDFSFRVTPKGLRTVEINGGLDSYLLKTKKDHLSVYAASIKKRLTIKVKG